MTDRFTPTQRLILDSLGARYRLGETLFAFDGRLRRPAEVLEKAGLVDVMNGNVEHSIRLSLTAAGRTEAMSATYQAPLEQERDRLQRRVDGLLGELSIALSRKNAA